ncbi:hypothetical protein MPK67_gp064 [Erwinia phage pEa_SNUABM_32]|uniref:Uncharacterized protein n=2 Tax=Alexandravirus TaxID=2733088 RepID=A0AAE8BZV0_9CAUD|nr:hypothetical protein MPK67_gp064 [Erwinia phage pEa_SNUABM_32]YP_010301177.1 hypothetical protein MPK68_gp064 [Erwinia phage pEa_SNUABM_3]QZE56600.1 hypothetical protein pEaSNUABM20_00064 [Erwinia phage pEa_SNUABM_20]UAW52845.1 hypothetical protein pEaSNUABM23_00063 [Erwinia phage pEa_SNUABM_23]UIW10741.1 hypothetical protein pEaSNUABM23_00063 [Erwinia phage pEa_SNUABM_31]QZE56261.1 hypothetical protein pEaSNUABM3_00064 [Erwinia phage pEa_SNUABM_3]QZE56937.1 hypothetical protein pEaSNUABM3
MRAMNWEVYVSPCSGLAYGQFAVAWGAAHLVIHTLDATEQIRHNCDQLYIDKLTLIIDCLNEFMDLLGTTNTGRRREWLNPIETGATGSVAYCYSVAEKESTVYFELGSCTDKIRFYPAMTGRNKLRNLKTSMERLRVELANHRQAMLDTMSVVNETRAMLNL